LVGVDDSPHSRRALDWAVAHADGRADRITLLHARHDGGDQPDWLEGWAATARASTPTAVATSVACGSASAALLSHSRDADLLVVGTRGRGGFSRLALGSTSSQCATHALGPTAVIGSRAPSDATDIAVGFDGSRHSRDALTWALGFARPGATVTVVGVWDAAPLAVGTDSFFFPEAIGLAHERFEELVGATAGSPPPGVTVVRDFRQGRARAELGEAAHRCDLLVVGARGHGTIGSAILGSVSSWLLHHADAPIVVVPSDTLAG